MIFIYSSIFSETICSKCVEVEESSIFVKNETLDDFKKKLTNLAKKICRRIVEK